MTQIKTVLAYVIYGAIGFVTLIAILSIWDIVRWEMVKEYFWKAVSSIITLLIGAVAVYVVYSVLNKPQAKIGDS